MRFLTATLLLSLALGACVDDPAIDTTDTTGQVSLPERMAPGSSVTFDELKLTFVGVTDDSRCPVDVVCVWAGDAKVHFTIEDTNSMTAQPAQAFELHPMGPTSQVTLMGHIIKLVKLEPAPLSTRPIEANDYRATIEVTRLFR